MKYSFSKGLKGELLSALVGLGRAAEGNKTRPDELTHQIMLKGIQMINPAADTLEALLKQQINLLHREKNKLISRCLCCKKQCGRNDDYLFFSEESTDTSLCSLKYVLLALIQTIGEHTLHLSASSKTYQSSVSFLYDSLFILGKNIEPQETNSKIVLGGLIFKQLVHNETSSF